MSHYLLLSHSNKKLDFWEKKSNCARVGAEQKQHASCNKVSAHHLHSFQIQLLL